MRKPSQDKWGKTLGAMGATMVLENYLIQAILNLYVLGSTLSDAHLC